MLFVNNEMLLLQSESEISELSDDDDDDDDDEPKAPRSGLYCIVLRSVI